MKKIITTIFLSAICCMASAQGLKSGYFLEGNFYRHQLNPAFGAERAYFSFPALGNLNIDVQSNMGLSTFLYESNDPAYDMTTFLDPSVSSSEFLDKLKKNNKIGANINVQILSAGFKLKKGYMTIDLGIKSNISTSLPKDLFKMVKSGMNSSGVTEYQFSDLRATANAYAEIGVGYSQKIMDGLRVGGKVKFLIGGAYAQMAYDKLTMRLSEDQWDIDADGYLDMALTTAAYDTELHNGRNKVTGINTDGPSSLFGGGFAIDLGAVYQTPIDGLEVSMAILDLGFIKWNNINRAISGGNYTFDGFDNIQTDKDAPDYDDNSIDTQLENLGDDLQDLFQLYTVDGKESKAKALAATLNIGAEYTMPFYDRMSAGFLSSTRIAGNLSTSEGRFYANVRPVDVLDLSVNYSISSYGSSFGWMINVHPRGFNFFIGSDSQFFKVSPQFLGIKRMNTNISMGINFPLGSRLDI